MSAWMRVCSVVASCMSSNAALISIICFSFRRVAASAVASGSRMWRNSCTVLRNWRRSGETAYQLRTSRSSRFQRSLGSTQLPIFGREASNPLAINILIASLTAVRLTLKISVHCASFGRIVPGG
ncbi:hypothetical protein D9M70_535590 [compost metagenome]